MAHLCVEGIISDLGGLNTLVQGSMCLGTSDSLGDARILECFAFAGWERAGAEVGTF